MISGKSFADACAWVVDDRYSDQRMFSYANAKHGDWVFVNGDRLMALLRRIPMLSPRRFNIIVHNSDRPFGDAELRLLLPVAVQIYAINTTVRHPRLTTIPIGFPDRQLAFLATFQRPDVPRDIDIYSNFSTNTNPKARGACRMVFADNPAVTHAEGRSVPDYYADLCRSRFVLCPEGTGIDTHRVYEAILCGATPVVLRNSLSHLYARLPVCIVDRWTDPFYVPKGKSFPTDIQSYLTHQ